MKIQRRGFLGITVLLLGLLTVGISARAGDDKQEETKIRWDIVSIQPPPPSAPRNVFPGGTASARANDGSKITLTGSGTFEVGEASEVTGGGTWVTFSPSGAETRGTYRVTRLIRFEGAPGTQPPGNIDRIGTDATVRAGLAVLGIAYSDRSKGTLIVSCHLAGTPDSVFEGITATKGFVGFWNREAPANGVDANRTVFHIVPEAED